MPDTDPNVPPTPYSEEELDQYFKDPNARRTKKKGDPGAVPVQKRAFQVLMALLATMGAFALVVLLYIVVLSQSLPPLQMIENPDLALATVAYTADGEELARYARENRTSVTMDEMSPYVIQALVATEDHRFEDHWGIDIFRTVVSVGKTVLGKLGVPGFYQQGGSTISQQLARNLYVTIGFEANVERKLKEMLTAVQIERSYTKQEIIEMYLNTVPFNNNAWGIEAAAKTYFNTTAAELNASQAATLVGLLKGTTLYNPVRNPERSEQRRNVVLTQMVKRGYLASEQYAEIREQPIELDFNPISHEFNFAPYFAEKVRLWLQDWAKDAGYDIYTDGLRVYTTLDSEMQRMAQAALVEEMMKMQAVVDVEWAAASMPYRNVSTWAENEYLKWARENEGNYDPFAYFWSRREGQQILNEALRTTPQYRTLRDQGLNAADALGEVKANEALVDSVKTLKSRIEGGLVSVDPATGYVKAWVGGRDYTTEKFDHVVDAKRQPGSTFKPFLYTAAIDNGWSPYYMLPDDTFAVASGDGKMWRPTNSGSISGDYMTLREALRQSVNTVTARLAVEVGPSKIVEYAKLMGVESELDEVFALALGVSDVTLLEMVRAYSTLANYGERNDPIMVTRIEDRFGNLVAEFEPTPTVVLSANTSYTMVDILRGVVQGGGGTGSRMYWKYGLNDYDFAGKTGTTQNSADGWFMLVHPELVTGAWVGFNDRRIVFRTSFWGQGAHNALHVVGNYWKRLDESDAVNLTTSPFTPPENYTIPLPHFERQDTTSRGGERRQWGARPGEKDDKRRRGRIGW